MAKPTFSLPVLDARTTKRLLDDEVNRYGGLIWDGTIVAASDPTLAQQVRDDVAQSAADAQQSAADAALYDGPRYPDVTAFFTAPDNFTAGNYVRTDAEGFAYKAVDTATATTVANAAPQAFEVLETNDGHWNALAVGATGDGVTDDAAALNKLLKFNSALIPLGTYSIASGLVGTDGPYEFFGRGYRRAMANVGGSHIVSASDTISDTLTFQSASPDSGRTTRAERLDAGNFRLTHKGTGAGILVNNVIKSYLHDGRVDCDGGAVGVEYRNWGFFARNERYEIEGFTDVGVKLSGAGSQHVIRDGHFQSREATAVAAIEVNTNEASIIGGQYNINRADNAGVGILVNRDDTEVGAAFGVRIENVIFEKDIGVKFTGDTKPVRDGVVEKCWFGNTNDGVGVWFDRANNCVVRDPIVPSPSFTQPVVKWGANSDECGVVCSARVAAEGATFEVDPAAKRAWMLIQDRLSIGDLSNVFTDPNLTVICESVEMVGRTFHNGVNWDKHIVSLAEGTSGSVNIPYNEGVIRISSRHSASGAISYLSDANFVELLYGGSIVTTVNNTALTGTSGTDGDVTLSVKDDVFYIENRFNQFLNFLVVFEGREDNTP